MRAQSIPGMNRPILDEASAWFVDFRVGDVDSHARERFGQWLRQSPEHIRAYMEIAKTYVELPAFKGAAPIDIDALIASARRDAPIVSLDDKSPGAGASARVADRHRAPGLQSWRGASLKHRVLAASLAVVAAGGAFGTWLWFHRYPTYSTEIGENRSVTLADGSLIDLNARSRVRVEFLKGERDVELVRGQALFEVAKDAARPFIVRSGAARVRAVGTQFDVNLGRSGTTVTVVEGRVAVVNEDSSASQSPPAATLAQSGEPTRSGETGRSGEGADVVAAPGLQTPGATYVSAGEQVTVIGAQVTKPKAADVAAATAWTAHRLIFEGTRLADVVDEFTRYNTRIIVIEDTALNDFHVSGVYASTDPALLIRFLKEQPGIKVVESDQAVRIMRP
jgi:transmembrane sensor